MTDTLGQRLQTEQATAQAAESRARSLEAQQQARDAATGRFTPTAQHDHLLDTLTRQPAKHAGLIESLYLAAPHL